MLFSQVIGQEDAKTRLRHSFKEGRLAHAIMLVGPEGSGNLALALAFAQYISCPNKTETDACGQCPTCKKHQSFQFADMYFSFPYFNKAGKEETVADDYMAQWRTRLEDSAYFDIESWRSTITEDNKQLLISVYEAGNIVRKLSLKSYEGGYKFMLIWMADYLKTDTANKLLKIVEEPPENTVFLLVANSIEHILPTILSRVQTIQIPKIADSDIQQSLEQGGLDAESAGNIAHFSDGNYWRALRLSKADDANAALSVLFQSWMRFCYSRDLVQLTKWVDEISAMGREDQKQFIVYALEQIRQNLLRNYLGDTLIRMNESEYAFSQKFAPFINDLNAEDLLEELNSAHVDISRNASSKIVFMDLSLRTHHMLRRQAAVAK